LFNTEQILSDGLRPAFLGWIFMSHVQGARVVRTNVSSADNVSPWQTLTAESEQMGKNLLPPARGLFCLAHPSPHALARSTQHAARSTQHAARSTLRSLRE
jgi:hypothetical protein